MPAVAGEAQTTRDFYWQSQDDKERQKGGRSEMEGPAQSECLKLIIGYTFCAWMPITRKVAYCE